jgi:hypothetical protein
MVPLAPNGADWGQYGRETGKWGMVVQVATLVGANGVIDGGLRWGPVLWSGPPPMIVCNLGGGDGAAGVGAAHGPSGAGAAVGRVSRAWWVAGRRKQAG